MISNIAILLGIVMVFPILAGMFPAAFLTEQRKSLGFMWISGCMMVWALFQVLCVYATLRVKNGGYLFLRKYFLLGLVGIAGFGVIIYLLTSLFRRKKSHISVYNAKEKAPLSLGEKIAFGVFILLVLFQLFMAVFYTYGDGDDAYYVAISTLTRSSKTLYELMPYSTGSTTMDMRHSLAPFPIWIALLADYSNLNTVVVAHTMLPPVLILATYVIYYKIGQVLFQKKKQALPIFLCFVALITIFGDTSFYTVENFMLARSRQGKAALGSIVIPMLFYIFIRLFERVQQEQKIEPIMYIVLFSTVTAACLCTTLGTFLSCMLAYLLGFLGAVVYKKVQFMILPVLGCIPAYAFALLYLKL